MSTRPAEPPWLVAQVAPHCERLACDVIQQGSSDTTDVETFCPWLWVEREHDRQRLFPGYVFVRTAPHHGWLRRAQYVIRLLGMDPERPATVSGREVSRWRTLMDWSGTIRLPTASASNLRPGDTVRLKGGPMSALTGLYAGMDSEQRVTVLFNILGRGTPVRCPLAMVEAA